jgi:dephospho-CoA kinase
MPGSGKTTVANAAKELGFEIISMGDVVREETKRRNMPLTDKGVGRVMLQLREEMGMSAVAKLCLPYIKKSKSQFVVIDGLRSMEEFKLFKANYFAKLLAVHASPELRFEFLTKRKRKDLPRDWKSFVERDLRELKVGVGNAIALADDVISNNNISLDELKRRAKELFKKWMNLK